MIPSNQQERLWNYVGGILKNHDMKALAVGGMEDHIHVLASLSSEAGVAPTVNLIKSNSSKWMRERFPKFGWQSGYAAFTVSASAKQGVIDYINSLAEHHKRRDFRAEYLSLLKRHGVEYDPKWVFD